MNKTGYKIPDYIFELSWEVCNKVGGIYTVLSTKAKTMQHIFPDKCFFIGPLLESDIQKNDFEEDPNMFASWQKKARNEGLSVKVGRWRVPGHPIALLVGYEKYYSDKNDVYAHLWADYGVDSLHAYGDYDEAAMFSLAGAKVIESFTRNLLSETDKIVFHGNEWMAGVGLLYAHKNMPHIATVFTTHATSIGRSIAFNGKPLYDYFAGYNGDQMAAELNMQSKHSLENKTAKNVDCFTTVSIQTDIESKQLLDKAADIVTPNGFENDFIPKGTDFQKRRLYARKLILDLATKKTGIVFNHQTRIMLTSGRNEFRNKGIDMFIDTVERLSERSNELTNKVVALVAVPCGGSDVQIENKIESLTKSEKIGIVFIPYYLDGNDPLLGIGYYDMLIGCDFTVYPSYYEPWGYTPLESVSFRIPTITSSVSGFGQWVSSCFDKSSSLFDGGNVVERNDHNYGQCVELIASDIIEFVNSGNKMRNDSRKKARKISEKATWADFFSFYLKAYHIALEKVDDRI